jgi:hypothetical protein
METPSYINIDSSFRDKNNYPNPFHFTVLENQVETWLKLGGCKQKEEAIVKIERMTIPYPRIELFSDTFIEVTSVAGAVLTSADHTLADGDIVEVITAPLSTSPFVYGTQYEVANANTVLGTFELRLLAVIPGASLITSSDQTYGGKNRLQLALVSTTGKNFQNAVIAAREILKVPQIFVDFYSKRYNDLDLIDTIGGAVRNAKFVVYTNQSLIQRDEYEHPMWIHYICDTPQVLRFKKNDAVLIRLQDRNGRTINIYPEAPTDDQPLKQLLLTMSFKW